ncbi:MAG: Uma2 family endonuclease, partial [Myxococcales bacterium]|nr:Uma2 family endonuclease [Myxococcales bacterium]
MVAARKLDTTIYPQSDHMGEGELQQLIDESLRPELARFLASLHRVAHVGSNTFIYYRQFDSSKRIAPDIYVLPNVAQSSIARSWKLWELPAPPSFALEVVSLDVDKDYVEAPDIHGRIGTKELVVFDPECGSDRERVLWQVFRPTRGGTFRLVERTGADRVRCRELGAFLRVVGAGATLRARVATGPRGDALFPTEAETEHAEKERERAEKERER